MNGCLVMAVESNPGPKCAFGQSTREFLNIEKGPNA